MGKIQLSICIAIPIGHTQLGWNAYQRLTRFLPNHLVVEAVFSVHCQEDKEDMELLAGNCLSTVVLSQKDSSSLPFTNSISHSRAVNRMWAACRGEHVCFCDYDLVPTIKDWYEKLSVLLDEYEFIGTPYSRVAYNVKFEDKIIKAKKYQNWPNIIFCLFKKEVFEEEPPFCLFEKSFGKTEPNVIPVETDEQEKILGLKKGEIFQADTAFNLAGFFYRNNIKTLSLERVVVTYKVLKIPFLLRKKNETVRPEEYHLNNEPLFAHYKKLSKSRNKSAMLFEYSYDRFQEDVDRYIEKT